MTSESDNQGKYLKSIALFFYLSFLDEREATLASIKAAKQFKLKTKGLEPDEWPALIVRMTNNYHEHRPRLNPRRAMPLKNDEIWQLPQDFDLSAWRQFVKETGPKEVLAVIWSGVLGFPDRALAAGLGLTIGSVRYRVGKGLRALGAMSRLNSPTKKR